VENLIWNSFEDFFFWSNRECELIMWMSSERKIWFATIGTKKTVY
jgi:hypothetical protein